MRRRYASEQLQWLVRKSAGMAPPSYLAQLQHHILECDQKSRNANIPASAHPCHPTRPGATVLEYQGLLSILEFSSLLGSLTPAAPATLQFSVSSWRDSIKKVALALVLFAAALSAGNVMIALTTRLTTSSVSSGRVTAHIGH